MAGRGGGSAGSGQVWLVARCVSRAGLNAAAGARASSAAVCGVVRGFVGGGGLAALGAVGASPYPSARLRHVGSGRRGCGSGCRDGGLGIWPGLSRQWIWRLGRGFCLGMRWQAMEVEVATSERSEGGLLRWA